MCNINILGELANNNNNNNVGTTVSGRGHFQDFRPRFRFLHICHVDRHGHFTLKQLRLLVLNEMHANSYTGPRLNTNVDKISIKSILFTLN